MPRESSSRVEIASVGQAGSGRSGRGGDSDRTGTADSGECGELVCTTEYTDIDELKLICLLHNMQHSGYDMQHVSTVAASRP